MAGLVCRVSEIVQIARILKRRLLVSNPPEILFLQLLHHLKERPPASRRRVRLGRA
jgi:hypothetical protein